MMDQNTHRCRYSLFSFVTLYKIYPYMMEFFVLFSTYSVSKSKQMPVQSQYNDAQYNEILEQVLAVLEQNNVKTDLALMVLGDALTHIFNQRVDAKVRQKLATQFCEVLIRTIKE